MRVIGVDPGLLGAVCLLGDDDVLDVLDMPVVAGDVNGRAWTQIVLDWLSDGPIHVAAVERVHSMPKQGVSSTFTFGKGYGRVGGVLDALGVLFGIPVVHPTPQEWTKHHRVGSDKELHRKRALDRWPAQAELFRFKKHSDRADAALIAAWAKETAT